MFNDSTLLAFGADECGILWGLFGDAVAEVAFCDIFTDRVVLIIEADEVWSRVFDAPVDRFLERFQLCRVGAAKYQPQLPFLAEIGIVVELNCYDALAIQPQRCDSGRLYNSWQPWRLLYLGLLSLISWALNVGVRSLVLTCSFIVPLLAGDVGGRRSSGSV